MSYGICIRLIDEATIDQKDEIFNAVKIAGFVHELGEGTFYAPIISTNKLLPVIKLVDLFKDNIWVNGFSYLIDDVKIFRIEDISDVTNELKE